MAWLVKNTQLFPPTAHNVVTPAVLTSAAESLCAKQTQRLKTERGLFKSHKLQLSQFGWTRANPAVVILLQSVMSCEKQHEIEFSFHSNGQKSQKWVQTVFWQLKKKDSNSLKYYLFIYLFFYHNWLWNLCWPARHGDIKHWLWFDITWLLCVLVVSVCLTWKTHIVFMLCFALQSHHRCCCGFILRQREEIH